MPFYNITQIVELEAENLSQALNAAKVWAEFAEDTPFKGLVLESKTLLVTEEESGLEE